MQLYNPRHPTTPLQVELLELCGKADLTPEDVQRAEVLLTNLGVAPNLLATVKKDPYRVCKVFPLLAIASWYSPAACLRHSSGIDSRTTLLDAGARHCIDVQMCQHSNSCTAALTLRRNPDQTPYPTPELLQARTA